METKELYYPQISAQAGSYTFEEGVELIIERGQHAFFMGLRPFLAGHGGESEGDVGQNVEQIAFFRCDHVADFFKLLLPETAFA